MPDEEEALKLQARFGTISSPAVFEAFGEALDALSDFRHHVRTVRVVRQHVGGDLAETLTALQEAREKYRATVPAFQRLISDELARL